MRRSDAVRLLYVEVSMPRHADVALRRGRSAIARALASWRTPLQRDGVALVWSHGLTSVIGLLYWLLGARLFAPEVVGVNAVALSAMMLIGGAAHLNLTYALLRFIPVAGASARRLVAYAYAVAAVLSALVGAAFALSAGLWAPELVAAAGQGPLIVFFALAAPAWTLFTLQDYVLTAVGRATLVPAASLAFSLLKIALLVVVALAAVRGAIAVSWVAATALTVLLINLWLLTRVLPVHGRAHAERAIPITISGVARFASADYAGSLLWQVAMMGLPILVLARLGSHAAAAYGIVWQFGLALYLVPSAMGLLLVAHSAHDPGRVENARRTTVRSALLLVVPIVVVLAAASQLILSVFGERYADAGAGALALIALSAIPNVVTAAATNTARVRQRRGVQFGVPASISILVITLSWLLMPQLGVTAVGLAWLLAQCLVASVVLIVTAPWLPSPLAARIDVLRSAALLRRLGPGAIQQTGGGTENWRFGKRITNGSESVVVMVGPPEGPRALFKAADSPRGQAQLRQQTEALAALHSEPRLQHWTPLIPRVLGVAQIGDSYCITESLLPGEPGQKALSDPARRERLTATAVAAISELHRNTATIRKAGDAELTHWIHEPMKAVAAVLPRSLHAEASTLANVLDTRLRGCAVPVGWTHRDYLPINLLTTPDGQVKAIVDWCTADELGMPVLDVAMFLQLAQAMAEGEELGSVVLRWVADMPQRESDLLHGCQVALGVSAIAPQVLVLLGWLQHISLNISKSTQMASNPVWNRRNVRVVVTQAHDLLAAGAVRGPGSSHVPA